MFRSRPRPSFVAVAVVVWCLAPGRSMAQISISPTIAVYVPTTELVKAASGQEFKQRGPVQARPAFAFGVSPWASPRV